MSDSSKQASVKIEPGDATKKSTNTFRRSTQRNIDRKPTNVVQYKKFSGKTDGLEDYVFDVGINNQ